MADRRVARIQGGPADYSGNASGLAVKNETGILTTNTDGTQRPIACDNVVNKTTSFTAQADESGTTFVCNSTTSIVIQLPATQVGLKFSLVVKGLTTSGGHAFSPNAADKIMGNGLTKADDADLVCSAATDREGDLVELTADGVDGWFITRVIGTFA